MKPRAVVSLGTNTTRLLVVRDLSEGGIEQFEHGAIGTRLGEGLDERGSLAPAAMERTLAAVESFMTRVRARDAAVSAIATSAMRRADNAAEFAERVRALTGAELRILEGDEEASYGFRGAMANAPRDGRRRAVLDVGGGSTEFAVGSDGVIEASRSVEIGSVRLTERFKGLAGGTPGEPARVAAGEARAAAGDLLGWLRAFRPVAEVRCVAGTPLTIGAIALRSDVEHVSGYELSRAQIERVVDRLLDLTLEERKAVPGMLAQRADVLAAGGIIVGEALRLLGCERARLEADDLLLGFLLMHRP